MSSEVAMEMYGSRWKQYPAYRDSGVEWIGEVPEEWEVRKLKHIALVKFSSVDKKTEEGELPVCLCNYVDVYYNDYITSDLDLMKATASVAEIQNFTLRGGDILITKDSESWDDIAVPSYVSSDFNNVLCGYHLAQIRPNISLSDGEYLFRSFCARGINDQFKVAATGVTRYGLGKYWLENSLFLVPPLPEQHTIAAFLDRETGRIDTLIEKKERQIELLQEKRAALISHTVTKGLDPDVKMKDSGVEWLEEIPEHWDETITSALFMDNKKKNRGTKETNLLSLSYGNIIRKDINTNDGLLPETFEAYQIVDSGYIILRLTDLQNDKRSLRVGHVNEKGIITSAYTGLIKKSGAVECSKYFYYLLHTYDLIKVFYGMGAGVRQSLNFNELRKLRLLLPPSEEQTAIAAFIDRETEHIDTLTTKIQESISKLREYRTALISAAVTGKIDVRQEVMA